MNEILQQRLQKIKEKGLYRSLKTLPNGSGIFFDSGEKIINFSSNDYLNLSPHPRVKQAAALAADNYGGGAPSSRLMSGHLTIHHQLECALADLMEMESALVFGSGFLANLGVITSLVGKGDCIFSDKLCHASLIDGIRLSGASSYRFAHNDLAHLEKLLQAHCQSGQLSLIVTESVFSMDGDIAPLEELIRLGRRYGALLMIDEAHAIGVFGHRGGGSCSDLPEDLRPDIVMGTMGKALGAYGGFCAVSAEMRDYFINFARPFIFSTALPPAVIAAAYQAVQLILEQPDMGNELRRRTHCLCRELTDCGLTTFSPSSIVPVILGDNKLAVAVAERLRCEGILVSAIRPPTVPAGTARLRLSVTLAHTEKDLRYAAQRISRICRDIKGEWA